MGVLGTRIIKRKAMDQILSLDFCMSKNNLLF